MGQIKIISPGLMTTVQDLGRYGYQQYGVSVSGAMDYVAAKLANILSGNNENEGLLEITLMGPKIEFLNHTVIAITGGDMEPLINDMPVKMNKSMAVKTGDILSFKGIKKGCRAYVSFAGGVDVPIVMGSKSTFLKAKIGGLDGRALKTGDILDIGSPSEIFSNTSGREAENFYDYGNGNVKVRVVLGPQYDHFTNEGIERLFLSEYTVNTNSDRMGYTLEGAMIQHRDSADIISDGIAMGAIQVPSNGNPIIMMADRQTTGGYTKIATVITPDLPILGQMSPGNTMKFEMVSVEESHRIYKEYEEKFIILSEYFKNNRFEFYDVRQVDLNINGTSFNVGIRELE